MNRIFAIAAILLVLPLNALAQCDFSRWVAVFKELLQKITVPVHGEILKIEALESAARNSCFQSTATAAAPGKDRIAQVRWWP